MKNWMLVYGGEDERVEGTPIVEAETKEEALTLMADALTEDNEVFTYATDGDVIYQSQESDPLRDPDARSFDILEEAEEMKRWEYPYMYDEQICNATNKELLKWAEEADDWDEFSCECLHDLCWRLDLNWGELGEDPYEIFTALKKRMED